MNDLPTPEELREESEQKAANMKKWLMSPDGQENVATLEQEFADRTSHVPGDPYTSAFNEGQRSVVLFLKDIIESNYNG